jgi:hypothetical protein
MGLMMHGGGSTTGVRPSVRYVASCTKLARVKKVSRCDSTYAPVRKSCREQRGAGYLRRGDERVAVAGRADVGLGLRSATSKQQTPMRTRASARAVSVCGTWMFISSPSKSALYGVHTHSLKRSVRQGSTFTCTSASQHHTT